MAELVNFHEDCASQKTQIHNAVERGRQKKKKSPPSGSTLVLYIRPPKRRLYRAMKTQMASPYNIQEDSLLTPVFPMCPVPPLAKLLNYLKARKGNDPGPWYNGLTRF